MNALTLIFVAFCVFAIAYRFYGLFLARKVLGLKCERLTPAVTLADGHDYVKTNKFVLFGHHFAAIAAAGPLLGPVLAAQYGYMPGALWILIGCVVAGAVHDMVVLFASVRHKGRSLGRIAGAEIGGAVGRVAGVAVLFILILALAGLSIAVVNAMAESTWGTFTVFATIPIALIMGVYLHVWRVGDVKGASAIGVVLLFLAVVAGPWVVASPTLGPLFHLTKRQLSLIVPAYGFVASILPVWLLLCPRDYLSTYLKIGTIAMLAGGIAFVRPELLMPAFTQFTAGGGPVIPGPVFPFIFITIACGALSGFHAIIGTGTTPKMIGDEKDVLFVGYGAMLMEGFVAVMALVAACVLVPADYFAINAAPAAFAKLGISVQNLPALAAEVQENIQGRPGGAVSLAVGMAYVFSSVPFMSHLMSYWYHFAIMFEAVFILTAVDTGTRVGRFFLQEMVGAVAPRFMDKHWWPGIISTSAVFTCAWGYLVYTGDIGSIWPLLGMSNQLLAASGLIIGTTMIIRMNKARYAWLTAVPGIIMAFITIWAGYLNIVGNYLPKGQYLLSFLGALVIVLMTIVFAGAIRRWTELLRIDGTVSDPYGEQVLVVVEE
ncbi:carbon starvation CstA family protein [Desulfovibrio aminophilus]|uniref:carbon starvation CstA family protein n=1 Tax=Desulfovibrio aminophilus TaxID=81425 RepID=UPI000414E07C|nr:carbon starvation protein A [Desulfovibrio aminophilus]